MPRRIVGTLLACTCFVVAGGPTLAGQKVAAKVIVRDDAATALAVRWVDAVLGHSPGQHDRAVEELATWNEGALESVRVELSVLRILIRDDKANIFMMPGSGSGLPLPLVYGGPQLETLRNKARDVRLAGLDGNDLVARGILLHTDVALLGGVAGTFLNFADGDERGLQRRVDHWAVSRALASLLDQRSGRLEDVGLWYRATLALMAHAEAWSVGHADAAVTQLPDDADILFLAGSLHETLATPHVQATLDGLRLPGDLTLRIMSAREELRLAVSLLRRAVDRNPSHTEARIHYGRVLTLAERPGDALAQMRRAAAEATELEQRYYARLFLGAAAEAANQYDEARTAYQAAANLFPGAQSPRLALSQLATRAGDRAAALSAIEPLLVHGADDRTRHDPWWTYATSTGRNAEPLIAQARASLATPRRPAAPR